MKQGEIEETKRYLFNMVAQFGKPLEELTELQRHMMQEEVEKTANRFMFKLATERRKAVEKFVLYCMANDDAVERITDYGTNQLREVLETYLKESEAEND